MNFENTLIVLPEIDIAAQSALRTGWLVDPVASQRVRVVAREVVHGVHPSMADEIIFEKLNPRSERPPGLSPWMQAIRAFSLSATITPCLAALALVALQGWQIERLYAVSALLGVCLLQVAVNVLNDVEDYRKLIDLPNTTGGSGVIQKGWWSPNSLRQLAYFSLVLGSVSGGIAVFARPELLFAIALAAGIGVLGYSGRPFGFKYRALGDLTVFILCGPALTVAYSVAISNRWDAGMVVLGSYFGLLATALLHINNLQDMKLDHSRGVATIALKLGFRGAKFFLYFLYGASYLILGGAVLLKVFPYPVLGALVPETLLLWPLLRRVHSASGPESNYLSQSRISAAQVHLISGLSLCVSLLVSIFWIHK